MSTLWLPGDYTRETHRTLGDDWPTNASGICVPHKLLPEPPKPRPVGIDLFAGAGGFSLGFHKAGFDVAAALDYDAEAMWTYLTNLGAPNACIYCASPADRDRLLKVKALREELEDGPDGTLIFPNAGQHYRNSMEAQGEHFGGCRAFFFGDVRQVTGAQILSAVGMERGQADCVFGGPPCQGFSHGNSKRGVMDPRNSLVFEFARLVLEIHPKTLCMENVPGILDMVTPEGVPVVDALCRVLEDGGFGMADALRRSLLGTSGAGLANRGASGTAKSLKARDERKDAQAVATEPAPQLGLAL